MNTEVRELRCPARREASSPGELPGWLVLSRRVQESFLLAAGADAEAQVRVTLLNNEPITLELDVPQVGVVQMCLHAQGRVVKFGVRASSSVRILRKELQRP